ncbi:MAG: electron transfer flavoprotein subunit alpha/FixB family protein [Acidobacteria bacterium]|nr:electron transfer flavoprotein subunit alpha/FixB family protein [Acidobacteriota bacterium]
MPMPSSARPPVLVIAEQRAGSLNPVTWETVAAAQAVGGPISVALAGAGLAGAAAELASADVSEVLIVEDPALERYTPDGFIAALAQVIEQERPGLVLFPHTYQTRDYAPALASRLGRVLIPDCVGATARDGGLVLLRPMFQGKFVAEVAPAGDGPHCVSFQIGAWRADAAARGGAAATRAVPVTIDAAAIRQRPEEPFQEAKQAVDLTQAKRIVAVGRGIKGQEHLPLAQELARSLGAELAASRPICDSGWLPMDRQIGSSGQTVSPKLYVALGISGAIQHLVGMKGSRTIVAVNKDADAPIFEVADYGIVGDLFEVVPALVAALGE